MKIDGSMVINSLMEFAGTTDEGLASDDGASSSGGVSSIAARRQHFTGRWRRFSEGCRVKRSRTRGR